MFQKCHVSTGTGISTFVLSPFLTTKFLSFASMNHDDMPIGDIEDAKAVESTEKTTDSRVSTGFGSGGAKGDLVWSGLNLKLMDKKSKDGVKLNILKDVWGTAQVGKTTAIMGASGAGSKSPDACSCRIIIIKSRLIHC